MRPVADSANALALVASMALTLTSCGPASDSRSQTDHSTPQEAPAAAVVAAPQATAKAAPLAAATSAPEHDIVAGEAKSIRQVVRDLSDDDPKIRAKTAREFFATLVADLGGSAPSLYESFLSAAAAQTSENQQRIMAAFYRGGTSDDLVRLQGIAADITARMTLRSKAIDLIGMNADATSFDFVANLAINDGDPLVRESAKNALGMITSAMTANPERVRDALDRLSKQR